ncbi:MAG: ABC transporter ATP-binding protein [Chloroflexota bacterium]|nr:ABC transporter ATP-binding protein [Chloroflexota bacterium]
MRLVVQGICFNYKSRTVLKDISMEIWPGQITALVGPNGSGKTTLLKCIAAMLKPNKGTIVVNGYDMQKVDSKRVAKSLGYVPQSAHNVFPCTVFDAVLIGRTPYMTWGVKKDDRIIVNEAMDSLSLLHMADRNFNEISAGEQQKVLIARALAQEPEVLLLDEPTSNLDLRYQLDVLTILRNVTREKGSSAIIAIHDLNLASRFSDQIVLLKDGSVYDAGNPQEVLTVDNIRSIYEIEVVIGEHLGRPNIMVIGPA